MDDSTNPAPDATPRPGSRTRLAAPRPVFLAALAVAALAWWAASEPRAPAPRPVAAAPVPPPPIAGELAPDQTLSGLWVALGLPADDLPAVTAAGERVISWRELRSGSPYRVRFDVSGRVRDLALVLDRDRRLVVARSGDGYAARLHQTPLERRSRRLHACIEGSPWQTLSDAGEDPGLTVSMAEVLAAQVDFYNDLAAGDCFDLAFTVDQRPDGTYKVVSLDAMRLTVDEKTHEAYRFAADGERADWFDAEGRSLKRRFLRSPLKFTRISSGFGVRMHPILRRARAHNGVDYVAPAGTPVQASGDGVVKRAGRNGGFGNYVEIHHGDRYVTSYAHLQRIAEGVRAGARVAQGQVIGYVGSTGMSTGAHLDYRFQKDGRFVDPLSTDLPTAVPLEGAERDAFLAFRDSVRTRMDVGSGDLATPGGTVPTGT